MAGRMMVGLVLALSLAGCGSAGFDELSYSVDVDADKGTALFACTRSSGGHCILRFDGATDPAELTVAVGETGVVRGVGPGSTYCATSGSSGAKCHGQSLQLGTQSVRHIKRKSWMPG